MIWNNWNDFWAMGGYALYVWGSFGVTAGLMTFEMHWVKQARNQVLKQLVEEKLASEVNGKDWH
jgi:heme exporter protein D